MGLDSRITWIGRLSDDRAKYYKGKRVHDIPLWGIDEEDVKLKTYDNVRHLLTPIEVIETRIDWDLVKSTAGVPEGTRLYGMGPGYIKFGNSTSDAKIYTIDADNPRFKHDRRAIYYYMDSELEYEWSRGEAQNKIRDLFDKAFPETLDFTGFSHQMIYGKYYELTDELLFEMKSIDPEFAAKYNGGTKGFFYSADW